VFLFLVVLYVLQYCVCNSFLFFITPLLGMHVNVSSSFFTSVQILCMSLTWCSFTLSCQLSVRLPVRLPVFLYNVNKIKQNILKKTKQKPYKRVVSGRNQILNLLLILDLLHLRV